RDRYSRGEFGSEPIEAKRTHYTQVYWVKVAERAQALAAEMTKYYANHRPAEAGFDRDLQAMAGEGGAQSKLQDLWGHRFLGAGQFNPSAYSYLTLRSAGAGGRGGGHDEITIPGSSHHEKNPRHAGPTLT